MKLLPAVKHDFFFSTSLSIFLARFFPSLANTVVMILFSRKLEQSSYGLYQNFWVQLLILSAIATAGIPALVVTYQKTFITSLFRSIRPLHYGLFLGWLLLLSIIFSRLQPDFSSLTTIGFLLFYATGVLTESILIAYRKFRLLIAVNVSYTIVFILIHELLLRKKFSMEQLFFYLMMLSLLKTMVCLGALNKERKTASPSEAPMPYSSVRSLWLHLGLYDVTQVLFRWVDKFILGFFLTRELFAVYFNGSVDIPFLPLLLGAAGSAVLMQLATNKSDDTKDTVTLMHRSSRLLSSLVFPLFFFLVFYRYELFTVVFTERYLSAVPVFLAAVMVIPLRAYNFTTVLQNRHKGAIINAGAVVDLLLACGLMYPLYTAWGLPGIALSFVVSTYLQAAFYLVLTARLLRVPVPELIPWQSWAAKLVVFGLLLIGVHRIAEELFAPGHALLTGFICMLIIMTVSLLRELRSARRS